MTNRLNLTCEVYIGIRVRIHHLVRHAFFSASCSCFVLLSCFIKQRSRALHLPSNVADEIPGTGAHESLWEWTLGWECLWAPVFWMEILITRAWEVVHLVKTLNTKAPLKPCLQTPRSCESVGTYMYKLIKTHDGMKICLDAETPLLVVGSMGWLSCEYGWKYRE